MTNKNIHKEIDMLLNNKKFYELIEQYLRDLNIDNMEQYKKDDIVRYTNSMKDQFTGILILGEALNLLSISESLALYNEMMEVINND